MKCPHCSTGIHPKVQHFELGNDCSGQWKLDKVDCPECRKSSFLLTLTSGAGTVLKEMLVWPKGTSRPPCPPEVPDEYAEDYKEACLVFADSPKASAALSRRCLQNIIQNVAGITKPNLYQEIEEYEPKVPSHIAELLHSIRELGNLATHPLKSAVTGQILEVEPQEADWLLEILEALFDHLFVAPQKNKARAAKVKSKYAEKET